MTSPLMLIVCGPNGAGKTTFTSEVLDAYGLPLTKLNADEVTVELRKLYPEKPLAELNLLAVQQIDAEVEENIKEGKSFYLETVLSSPKYRDDVLEAKKNGFEVAVVYVSDSPSEVSAARVKVRAQKGGHDVEPPKVMERYKKSHEQLKWFGAEADIFLIFDNSSLDKPPLLLAEKLAMHNIVHRIKGVNPTVDAVISFLKATYASPSP